MLRSSAGIRSMRSIGGVIILAVGPGGLAAQQDAPKVRVQVTGEATALAPGVISVAESNDEYLTYAPDGRLAVFTRREGRQTRLWQTSLVDGSWTPPRLVDFAGEFNDNRSAFTPDGRRLFFASNRPHAGAGSAARSDLDIWTVERTSSGAWGEPRPLSGPVNSSEHETHPSVASSGNLYFVRWGEEETDIFVAEWNGESYQEPRRFGPEINTAGPDSHPFIDPEERFLLFAPTGRADGLGGGDIYVSYPTPEGWSVGENLGPRINSDFYEYSARVGPDGRVTFSRAGFGEPETRPADLFVIDLEIRPAHH
ncbi:MAG: hypothetical protein ABFS34_16915 [Gemmatimonadota bacterium]